MLWFLWNHPYISFCNACFKADMVIRGLNNFFFYKSPAQLLIDTRRYKQKRWNFNYLKAEKVPEKLKTQTNCLKMLFKHPNHKGLSNSSGIFPQIHRNLTFLLMTKATTLESFSFKQRPRDFIFYLKHDLIKLLITFKCETYNDHIKKQN